MHQSQTPIMCDDDVIQQLREENAKLREQVASLEQSIESILFMARGATCDENKFRICEIAQLAMESK